MALKAASKETPVSSGLVKRYNAPVRCAYKALRATLDKGDITDADHLHVSVYADRATMVSEVQCTMFLVFGTIP